MGREAGEVLLVATEVADPVDAMRVVGVEQLLGLGDVALGGVGAVDPPEREVRLDAEGEAREAAEPGDLVARGKEAIRVHLHAVERGALLPGAEEDVAVGVPEREGGHGQDPQLLAGSQLERVHRPIAASGGVRAARGEAPLALPRTAIGSRKATVAGPVSMARRRSGPWASGRSASASPAPTRSPTSGTGRPAERR